MSDSDILLIVLLIIGLTALIFFATYKIIKLKIETESNKRFNDGFAQEKLQNFDKAIEIYKNIHNSSKLKLLSKLREEICKLKANKLFVYNFDKLISYKSLSESTDFYFRIAIKLSKEGNYHESNKVINHYLDKSNFEVKKLITYNDSHGFEYLKSDLNKINQLIENVLSSNSNIDLLIDNIYQKIKSIKSNFYELPSDLINELNRIEFSLINRITLTQKNAGHYKELVEIYSKSDKYLSDYEFVKNAAIFSYNLIEKGLIDLNNAKYYFDLLIIAIHNPTTILKTLEYTSWDDDYSFSLSDVLGFIPQNFKLPENVKWENATNNEILIRDLQNTLIADLQQIIHQHPDYNEISNDLSEIFNKQLEQFKFIQHSIPMDYHKTILSFDLIKNFNLENEYIPYFIKEFNKQKNEAYLDMSINLDENSNFTEIKNYIKFRNNWKNLFDVFSKKLSREIVQENLNNIRLLKSNYPNHHIISLHKLNRNLENKLDSVDCSASEVSIMINFLKDFDVDSEVLYKMINITIKLYNDKQLSNIYALEFFTKLHNYNNENDFLLKNLVIIIQNNFLDLTSSPYSESKITPLYTIISKNLSYRFFYFNKPINDLYNELYKKLTPFNYNHNINYDLLKKHLSIIKMFTSYGKSLSYFEY